MNRKLVLTSLLLAGLLICDPSAAQTTRPKRMLGKFEVFSTPARSGYIDTKGKVVIEKDFSRGIFRSFSGGLAAICQELAMPKEQRWGFVDKKGKAVVGQNYSRVGDFSEGLAAVAAPMTARQAEGLRMSLACIDFLPLSYDEWIRTPDNGWWTHSYIIWDARSSSHYFGPWGFVDKTGAVAIPLHFSAAGGFREGLAHASRGKISGFIDKSGKWVITSRDKKEFTGDFSEGLATFRKSEKEGCIDKKGNVVIPPKFYRLRDFSGGRAAFMTEDEDYGFIDKTGKIVIEAKYRNVHPFSEGLAAVRRYSGWSWIDVNGRVVMPRKYEHVLGFSCGFAAVSIDGKWGYIDKSGKMVLQPQFHNAREFDRGLAPVCRMSLGGRGDPFWGVIDRNGKFVIPAVFPTEPKIRDGMYLLKSKIETITRPQNTRSTDNVL